MLAPAIAFEAKMAEVGKVVDFEGKTWLADLGNDIQALVTSGALPMAADGIADIVAAAAQASLIDDALPDEEKRRQLVEFAEAAGKMGIAFDVSAEAAGAAMAVWRSQLGLTQDETILLGDAVNHLSNKMNATAADITDIIGRQGGFAKVAGLSTAEIAALATAFRTAAPSSEVAATAMKNFTATLVAGEAMTKRQSVIMERLGFDATELAQRMRTDARGSILDVMEALQQLPEHEQAASLRQLFGDEAVGAIAPLLNNLDNLRRAFELVGDETGYAGAMQAEFDGVAGTTAAKLIVFQNHLTRLSVALTPVLGLLQEVLAAVQPLLEKLTLWMQANPDMVRGIAMVLAGLWALKAGFLAVQLFVQPLIAIFWLFNGALGAGTFLLGAKAWVVARFARLLPLLVRGLGLVRTAVMVLGRTLLMNPIGLKVAAIAAAVYLIYRNWGPVSAWFKRLIGNIGDIFIGLAQFVSGIVPGDLSLAAEGFKRAWGGLQAHFQTLWDGISGVFTSAWENAIKPVTDALGVTDPIVSAWQALQGALGAVIDWLIEKFNAFMGAIRPVIDALTWMRDNVAGILSSSDSVMDRKGVLEGAANLSPPVPEGTADRAIRHSVTGASAIEQITGKRALGGPVRAGQMYRWMEEGQELFVPRTDGHVVSTREIRDMRRAARGGAGASTVNLGGITINAAPGQDPAAIARAVRRELSKAMGARNIALHDGGAYAV
ncbi:MAG: phage tail tape measure protein [Paracoccus sp. (in: a-proteobacteria)]|nr:phage tail tape measure protein [Paracoccus sp. (in: a-proteobacteria)]